MNKAKFALGVGSAASMTALLASYVVYQWVCRRSASDADASVRLLGDEIVRTSTTGYTVAVSISTPPSQIWPWLVQMGQGRAGFYTHEWVERFIGADIRNADAIVPEFQHLVPGDRIRLTPDPYLGKPGQALVVARVDPPHALVYSQVLPDGSVGTWSFTTA